eukprot:gene20852-22897_t
MDKFEWTCERCKKKFTHKKSVSRHIKTCRYSSKPACFACTSCQKNFNRLDVLKRHQKTCQQKKKTTKQCQICLKVFAKSSNLKRHQKIHNFELKCKNCNLMLHKKKDVVKHERCCYQNSNDDYELPTMVEIKNFYRSSEEEYQNTSFKSFEIIDENDPMEEHSDDCFDKFGWGFPPSKEVHQDAALQTIKMVLQQTPRKSMVPFTVTAATQTPTKGLSEDLSMEASTVAKATQAPTKSLSDNSFSSKARKRKSRLANRLARNIEDLNIENEQDKVKVVTLALKKLGMLETFNASKKPSKAGRRMTSIETRQKV